MKHECGGNIEVMSVVNISNKQCVVTLVCANCGEFVSETHYLYE